MPAPSTGFTSGVSEVLLCSMSIGEASSSVAENNQELSGNRFISYSRIDSLDCVVCNKCCALCSVPEDLDSQRRLVTRIKIHCGSAECG